MEEHVPNRVLWRHAFACQDTRVRIVRLLLTIAPQILVSLVKEYVVRQLMVISVLVCRALMELIVKTTLTNAPQILVRMGELVPI